MLRFSKDHEWVRAEGSRAVIGISDYAQSQLGDVVFVELPDAGKVVKRGAELAVVESVKAASEVYAAVGGTVVATNAALVDEPALVNSDPLGAGWFAEVEMSDPTELDALMDEAAYAAFVASLG